MCESWAQLRPRPNLPAIVWKGILSDAFSPLVHTKGIENADGNGGFPNVLQSGVLKTHHFESAPFLMWIGDPYRRCKEVSVVGRRGRLSVDGQ